MPLRIACLEGTRPSRVNVAIVTKAYVGTEREDVPWPAIARDCLAIAPWGEFMNQGSHSMSGFGERVICKQRKVKYLDTFPCNLHCSRQDAGSQLLAQPHRMQQHAEHTFQEECCNSRHLKRETNKKSKNKQ